MVHLHRHKDGRIAVVLDIDAIRSPHVSLIPIASRSRIGSHGFPSSERRREGLCSRTRNDSGQTLREAPRTLAASERHMRQGTESSPADPFVTSVPPMTSVQNVLWTSTSLTKRLHVRERDAHTIEGSEVRSRREPE